MKKSKLDKAYSKWIIKLDNPTYNMDSKYIWETAWDACKKETLKIVKHHEHPYDYNVSDAIRDEIKHQL